MAPRCRWRGDVDALATALAMEKPNEVKYNDRVEPKLILKQKARLCRLKTLYDRMNFRKSDCMAALKFASTSKNGV